MHGCVPSHAAADEVEYTMDFVSRIRHFAVTLRESLVSKAIVTSNAHGQLKECSTKHLALSFAHLDNSPRLHPPNCAQVHLQSQHDCLESSSLVNPCAQAVTSPGLNSSCQVHLPAQMDSSHGTSSPVHLPLQREGCETEHHQKDCSNAEFLRLAQEENLLEAVFDSIGMKVGELPHPSTMIDLFSFSCDLGFLSVTTEDVEFSKLCSKYYTAIHAYLDYRNNFSTVFQGCMHGNHQE